MLLIGVLLTVCGLVKLLLFSLLTLDGFIFQPTPCLSTTFSPDSKANSLTKLPLSLRTLIHLWITGFMRNLRTKYGTCLKRCTTGSDGTMAPTCFWLINQKLVGTSFQIEASTPTLTPLTVNTLLNMSITTTCTPTPMLNQDNREVKREHLTVNTCQ